MATPTGAAGMSRAEFSYKTRKVAFERAHGFCECGCGQPFGDHPKERPHYDHIIADFNGGRNTLDNCQVLRVDCHQAKTAEDMPFIKKNRREDKRKNGTGARKALIPGSKGSGVRKGMNGVVRWE